MGCDRWVLAPCKDAGEDETLSVRSRLAATLTKGRRAAAGELYNAGRALEKGGAWAEAAAAYQKAVDADPRHAEWYFRLGHAWEKAGSAFGAVTAYQQALARNPDQPQWHFRLGKVFLAMRDYRSAAYCFRQADKRSALAGGTGKMPSHGLSLERRIELSLPAKPPYAYCMFRAAQLASRLGIGQMSALELGVAGGNGLVAMESHAAEVEKLTGVAVSVYGLDTGEGLFEPVDVRDMPYYFAPGHYRMDVDKLRSRLTRAELVLGDARETFAEFVAAGNPPIGVIAFDMDYYSSTAGVLDVVGREEHAKAFLPRVYTYFDNITGFKGQDYNEFTGELLAIAEFNGQHSSTKFSLDRHFMARPIQPPWSVQIYTLHRFDHPDYSTYVGHTSAQSLRLRD